MITIFKTQDLGFQGMGTEKNMVSKSHFSLNEVNIRETIQ